MAYHVDGTADDDLLKRDFLVDWPPPTSIKLLVDTLDTGAFRLQFMNICCKVDFGVFTRLVNVKL